MIIVAAVFAAAIKYAVNTGDNHSDISEYAGIAENNINAVAQAVISDENDSILPQQENVLLEYAQAYGQSLMELMPQDISGLYADTDSEAYYLNKTALQVITTVRSMSEKDLKLESCHIEYDVTDAYTYNGKIHINLLENNTQKFKFMEDDSKSFIIQHEFVLEQKEDNWYITAHYQEEDFYLLVAEAWEKSSGTPAEMSQQVMEMIVADTKENIVWRAENYLNKSEEKPAAYKEYDRDLAVEYAENWVGKRNHTGVYLAYDEYGGNCQNFASQCLYAGGLDMDSSGYNQWKFYSKTLNEYAVAKGRSYSWTGVEPFYNYCRDNTGTGIAANVDWGTAFAQKGDIIQVGAMAKWRHSVFITDVVYDENGYADEIIIASNTADRLNYPLSAYIYTAPRLIHISGQN